MSTDLKEFRFSPLRCGNEGLACACQDAARRTPFDQLGFQFLLESGELPRHGRMVHTQTPSGTENLTRAGDLQEYADTIPIHRLRFPHNKSAIVLVDVQTLTFHGELRKQGSCCAPANQSLRQWHASLGPQRADVVRLQSRNRYLKSGNGACPKADMRASR